MHSGTRQSQFEGVGEEVCADEVDAVEITNRYRRRVGGQDAW